MKSEHSGKRTKRMPAIPAGEVETRGLGVQGPPELSVKFKACLFEALSQNKRKMKGRSLVPGPYL